MLMLLSMLLLWQQDGESIDEKIQPINARVFRENGRQFELLDVRLRGGKDYAFSFESGGVTRFISLLDVVSLYKLSGNSYRVTFADGSSEEGTVRKLTFTGTHAAEGKQVLVDLHQLARIHLVSGEQLRSCPNGHYERRTPYLFCPICGSRLETGRFMTEEERRPPTAATHRLGRDGRE